MKTLSLYKALPLGMINPLIYGHFSEHIGGVFYDGLWVGEDSNVPNIKGFRKDLVEKLRAIKPAVLRWPGGCFAETYDWRDGIGPRDQRPVRINWWTYHDKRYEPNLVGTHEFIELCRLIGAEPYFAANMTSMTPLAIRDWVDYCNSPKDSTTLAKLREQNGSPEPFNVKFWGVGNECWGGGGNMTPESYALEFRKYATLMLNADPTITIVACGQNGADWRWTEGFMHVFEPSGQARQPLTGYASHYYCGASGQCTDFSNDQFHQLISQALRMEPIVQRQWSLIKGWGLDEKMKLFMDEWGCWHPDGSGPSKGYNLFEQQSTVRDAIVSALTLNIFNNNCDKVMMANVAQLVNNLHCLFLAGKDTCILTPTYHVFHMFKEHQGATAIRTSIENPDVAYSDPNNGKPAAIPQFTVSASYKDDEVLVTITNASLENDECVKLDLSCFDKQLPKTATVTTLGNKLSPQAHNTFEQPECVLPVTDVQPTDAIQVPAASVVAIKLAL